MSQRCTNAIALSFISPGNVLIDLFYQSLILVWRGVVVSVYGPLHPPLGTSLPKNSHRWDMGAHLVRRWAGCRPSCRSPAI